MNNEGWGLSSMFVFCFIFLFGLTLSAIIYNKNFSGDVAEKENIDLNLATSVKEATKNNEIETEEVKQEVEYKSTSEYEKLEEKLNKVALSYVSDNNIKINNYKIIISLEELINKGYIKSINDPENNSKCNGYAVYNGEKISSYIKCIGSYQTDNYNKEFE